ncbi:hypothetical protein [Maribacter sp. R86514]|uniref:hypothetical protein n=1 Tax=Maribacter sp. R86514 TaxID=3093854 RepID=UPI0037CC49F5
MDKQLIEVLSEIQNTKSLRVYNIFKSLTNPRTVFYIFLNNYIELKKEIQIYYSETFELENGLLRRTSQKKLIRLYHNYLSSARVFTEQYVQEDIKDDFHCFIKELRNYSIHKGFFPLSSRFEINQKTESRYESLQVNKIEDYLKIEIENSKKRKQGLINALNYLNSQKPTLNLNIILEKYFYKMLEEYHYVMNGKISEYKEDLISLYFLIKKLDDKMKIHGLSSPRVLSDSETRYLKLILNK